MPPVGRRCHFSGGRPRQPHPPDIVAERSPWRKNGRVSKNRGEIPWQNTWQNVSRKKGSDQSGTCLSYGLRWNVLTVLSIFIHQTSNSYAPRNNKCEGWSYKPDGTLLHRLCFHRQLQHSYQKSSPDAQFRALSKYLENLLWTFKRKTKIWNHSPSVFLFFWNCFQLMSPEFMTLSARCHHAF